MKKLTLKHYFQMAMMGLLIGLSGFTLNGCSKSKNNGGPPGPGGPGYNNGYASAGCPIPGGVTQTVHSSLGAGSVVTFYVVRQGANQILLYADVVIPASSGFPALNSCLTPTGPITTSVYSGAFETMQSGGTLTGNGMSLDVVPGNTYIQQSNMMGQVMIQIPSYNIYNYYVSLTGI